MGRSGSDPAAGDRSSRRPAGRRTKCTASTASVPSTASSSRPEAVRIPAAAERHKVVAVFRLRTSGAVAQDHPAAQEPVPGHHLGGDPDGTADVPDGDAVEHEQGGAGRDQGVGAQARHPRAPLPFDPAPAFPLVLPGRAAPQGCCSKPSKLTSCALLRSSPPRTTFPLLLWAAMALRHSARTSCRSSSVRCSSASRSLPGSCCAVTAVRSDGRPDERPAVFRCGDGPPRAPCRRLLPFGCQLGSRLINPVERSAQGC